MDFASYRNQFPVLEKAAYLVSHSLGAMPLDAKEELELYTNEWATRGVGAWTEGWWDTPLSVGDELAPIVGAPPGSIAMVPNVTVAESIAASCFTLLGDANRVVCTDLSFPSVRRIWERVPGAKVTTVRSWDGTTIPTETFVATIGERTALVIIGHVLFPSSYMQDAKAIIERAHDVGAMVVLDVYQSAGVIPIDLVALGADFAVGGSAKWLCGGLGAGWLYVRKELQPSLEPRLAAWPGDRSPFDIHTQDAASQDGMWRFVSGTPNVPALYTARAGYRIIREARVAAIRDNSLRMTGRLIEIGDRLGIPLMANRDPNRRGGTVTFAVEDAQRVAARLAERQVIVEAVPEVGISVGPHFYNNDEDIDRFEAALRHV
ncbi:MAG: aminotransferase class V-fold PLP-dependent enzyme [Gammaproteobacteria bacterium]|nr:aminotransferase class V-fold PLP-dependent enzyme [Gammaproteobacteria bacterium]